MQDNLAVKVKEKAKIKTKEFKAAIDFQALSGVILLGAACFALILNNSPLYWLYDSLLTTNFAVKLGVYGIDKPILLWINDGLMAIFFFLIGLEIKRELMVGELSSVRKAALPMCAALGGLIVPALFFYAVNMDNPQTLGGWAIPVATDIAFALGILSLLGKRVPTELKVLLLSLAIIDDIAAIMIIAIFYTADLSLIALSLSGLGLCFAILLNRMKVVAIAPYVLIGVFMWVCVLKSGVHATLAGVALAFTIPMLPRKRNDPLGHNRRKRDKQSTLVALEHMLHPWVSFLIMPVFAFANAGVNLGTVSVDMLMGGLSLGIILGLFVGKQLGVFSFIWIFTKLGVCQKPDNVKWIQIYGLSLLTGIGFTMSLFIGTLAFADPELNAQVRVAVLIASGLSAVLGYMVLLLTSKRQNDNNQE